MPAHLDLTTSRKFVCAPMSTETDGSGPQAVGNEAIRHRQPPKDTHRHLDLDIGEERIRYRVKW